MAFAITTAGMPRIDNYTDALNFHARAAEKPWRNGGEDYPFPEKRARQYGVRKTANGSIAFRFHRTDVVTWHPDNSITLEVWNSQSTQAFANTLLPFGVSPTRGMTRLVVGGWRDGKVYPIARTVRIGPDHTTVETPLVWETLTIDRKVAKRVLADTRYAEYREWWTLMTAMQPDRQLSYGSGIFRPSDIVEALADKDRWHDLMTSYAALTVDHVRQAIYACTHEPVYVRKRVDYVIGDNRTKSVYAVSR